MKLSSLTLATTVALTFSGCVLNDALNSVTGTIDSITAPSKTTNTSNNSKMETKNLATVAQIENFCKNSPDGATYIITALPDLKRGELAGSAAEQLLVANSKYEIEIRPDSAGAYMNYGRKAFSPNEFNPYNPNEKVKLIKPMYFRKLTGNKNIGYCSLAYLGTL